jgi:DNA-binding CsgD family transcriptional regulator
MSEQDLILDTIEKIYEAATDPACMDRLASVIARAFGTDSGFLALAEPARTGVPRLLSAPSGTENFDSWARSSYANHYHQQNIWIEAAVKSENPVSVLHEAIDDTALGRSELSDFHAKTNIFDGIGNFFPISGTMIGLLAAFRARGQAAFDDADRRKMMQLFPHLQRALQIQTKLGAIEREHGVTLELLDGLAIGVIILAADGRLLFANGIAERVLHAGEGITMSGGRVRPQDLRARESFDRLVSGAAQTSGRRGLEAGGSITVEGLSGMTMALLISPLRASGLGFGPPMPAAMIVFADPARDMRPPPERVLAATYRLTPAEARLLAALTAGQRLSDYAEAAGIGISTARTHLRQVLSKSGHHRQVDLVRAVIGNPLMRLAKH